MAVAIVLFFATAVLAVGLVGASVVADDRTHAAVLSLDEKSQIQALDRTQPGLPIKPGRAPRGGLSKAPQCSVIQSRAELRQGA